ncbi:hypothetical protein [Nocardia iowensis]|uniref:Uncharacterized protein n=1 Tax=Nocardia iowensis TaxID=204891 RepID=A0ABX8RYT8_NOCIO|nr:hypothetical protein [Nocardia iowensis]QXN94451.1 hypothetical protein KV110_16165 [Nocardia iowensis]
MSNLKSWQRDGGFRAAWIVYAVAAVAGLLAPLSVMFADACYYLECRETVVPQSFSLGVIVVGVGITLVVAAVMLHREGRRGRPGFEWAVIALVGVFVSSCSGGALLTVNPWDGRPALTREARDIEAALARMPGVHEISTEIGGMFSAVVVLSEEASAAQTKAVIVAFRDRIKAAPDFDQWETEIEVHRAESTSTFRAGKAGFVEAPDRAGLWFALTDAFPEDEVKWTFHTWAYYDYGSTDQFKRMDVGVGDISLKLVHANDFNAVTETYRRLMREFPDLSEARWKIGPATPESGSLSAANRYPTELEFSVWHRLNEDQSLPHNVLMASGAAPIGVSKATSSYRAAPVPGSQRRETAGREASSDRRGAGFARCRLPGDNRPSRLSQARRNKVRLHRPKPGDDRQQSRISRKPPTWPC